MIQNISSLRDNINSAIAWVKKYKPEDFQRRFLQLAEERRKLKIIEKAERNNPGVAAFGQSQVGKSYLMNCILKDKKDDFMVDSPSGAVSFVDQINPIGEGKEATGVVTRFTAYGKSPEDYSEQYPIRLRSLTVRDLVLIICDTYYLDFRNYTTYGESDIQSRIAHLEEKYSKCAQNNDSVLHAEDILEMKLYVTKQLNNAQVFIGKTAFFDHLAIIIEKIPTEDYASVFSILWHNEDYFTDLFLKCMGVLQRMNYAEYLYVPIEAVLHHGVKEDTIMSVECLKQLYEDSSQAYKSEVLVKKDGAFVSKGIFTKSEICAVCEEVVIRVNERYVKSTGAYDMRNMPEESKNKLVDGNVSVSLLKDTDLLDFPGAKPRENNDVENISNRETLIYSFLRGKVAYLFNKYNEEKAINILLHCHHQKAVEATQMFILLKDWVNESVGDTPEKRARLVREIGGAPLFHVATFFNRDLDYPDNQREGMSHNALFDRWNARFESILALQVFHRQDVDWVLNWTGKGQGFQNCYLLRDYKFSKYVYSGYAKYNVEQEMLIDDSYYRDNREMFIKSNEEKHHLFKDSALSWDVAATIGNDGALYIIQQLAMVVEKMGKGRELQLKDAYDEVKRKCYDIMFDYYTGDKEDQFNTNIRKAYSVFRDLEFTCQNVPEFFGRMLKAFQLTEAQSFKKMHSLLPALASMVNTTAVIKDYELIRNRCAHFDGCAEDEDKWSRLIDAYKFSDKKEAEDYLSRRGINSADLFQNKAIARKNSAVISHEMLSLWKTNLTEPGTWNELCGDGMVDRNVMNNLITCLMGMAAHVKLENIIERKITDYVDVLSLNNINEDFVADVIATTISDFVVDFGYCYLQEEQTQSLRAVSRELPCFDWIDREHKEMYEEGEITALFDDILSSSNQITPAYDANYNCWLEYMYIAFMANVDAPIYDVEANNALKVILDELK